MKTATWKNGSRYLRGRWLYNPAANRFVIRLDKPDRVSGEQRTIYAYGDTPEWGNWKLLPNR